MGSKMYIVADEGKCFVNNLLDNMTFKDAFFKAADDCQLPSYNIGIEYKIVYYGPTNGGTLNDKLYGPLTNYENTGGKVITYIVNGGNGVNYE